MTVMLSFLALKLQIFIDKWFCIKYFVHMSVTVRFCFFAVSYWLVIFSSFCTSLLFFDSLSLLFCYHEVLVSWMQGCGSRSSLRINFRSRSRSRLRICFFSTLKITFWIKKNKDLKLLQRVSEGTQTRGQETLLRIQNDWYEGGYGSIRRN